jgi:hypothetical protein
MTALFTLPGQTPLSAGTVVPGAKLTFSQTGTSTLQNTYTTEALSVAHANPVVADASGTFPAIYLDPTLPSYRAVLTDANDVEIETWDGVPSTQGTQQSTRYESTNPNIFLYDTDGTVNKRKFVLKVSGNRFVVQAVNDAETVFNDVLSVINNTTDTTVTLPLDSYLSNGAGTTNLIADITDVSFAGALTGLTTSPTTTVLIYAVGNLAIVYITGASGTSNSTAFTITGIPAAFRPGGTIEGIVTRVIDNGTTQYGIVSVNNSGVMTFGVGATNGVFTGSGTKGVPDSTFCYLIN